MGESHFFQGEKAIAEREVKRLHGQKTLLERDISKRNSLASKKRDSIVDRGSKLFDPKRGKSLGMPYEQMQVMCMGFLVSYISLNGNYCCKLQLILIVEVEKMIVTVYHYVEIKLKHLFFRLLFFHLQKPNHFNNDLIVGIYHYIVKLIKLFYDLVKACCHVMDFLVGLGLNSGQG